MNKYSILILTYMISSGVWADCENPQTSHEIQRCLSNELSKLNKELNLTFQKLYTQTEAKNELKKAQKAWQDYKDIQCGEFTLADAGVGSGQIAYDLACQADLTEQRIEYLKNQIN